MWRILTSSKLAIWLIIILAIEMGIAMFVPQVEINNPNFTAWAINNHGLVTLVKALKLNEFFTTAIFLSTVSLFCLNTFCCTYSQVIRTWDNFKSPKLRGRNLYKMKFHQVTPKEIIRSFKVEMEKSHLSVKYAQRKNNTFIIANRNRWGLWGMVIFHIAIIWTILGAVWGVLNKVEGNAFVVEGFSFKEVHQNYTNIYEGLLFREKHAGFEVKIHHVNLKYRGKIAPTVDNVRLSINEEGQEVLRGILKPNQLLDYHGYKIMIKRRGYTPILEVDNLGTPQYNLLSLDVYQEPSGGESYRQKIFINDLQQEVEFLFFPSPPDNNLRNVDYRIQNPQLQLTYMDESGHKQIEKIGLNEPIIINGKKVSLVDAKPWIEVITNHRPGVYYVYFGFALALLGLSIYYSMPYQQISITLSKEGDLSIYTYGKLNSTKINKLVEKFLNEVTNNLPVEFTTLQRREEEVW